MGLISGLREWLAPTPPDASVAGAIELAVDRVDPRLRAVSGYQRKLAPAVGRALGYCDGLVAAIPGPIDIDARSFGCDPLVHALFAAPDEIAHMLGTSREVRAFLEQDENPGAEEFFALIGMRRKEKTVLGLALQGGTIQGGVPQRLLYFADHTLRELSLHPDQTRERLRLSSFESLACSFGDSLEGLRRERQDMHSVWEQACASIRAACKRDVAGADLHAQRRFEIEQSLQALDASLEPARVLEAFVAWLAEPEPHLRLVSTSVLVDRLGVLSPAFSEAEAQPLSLPELIGRDRRRWIVLVARVSRADALRAQEESRDPHRYLII